MGFILDSFANVMIEAIDTLVLWICTLTVDFKLDIGGGEDGQSEFGKVFTDARGGTSVFNLSDIATAIGVLAILCVLLATIFKIYQLIISPFAKVESPGEIALKFILSVGGVLAAYPLFRYFERGFNAAYSLFLKPYKAVKEMFKHKDFLKQKLAEEIDSGKTQQQMQQDQKSFAESTSDRTSDAFLLGSDHLIPQDEAIADHPFALALIELFVGVALMIALVRLVFEIYERYVILAVLYLFAPLAFASIVAKGSEVFKNYCWMVICQFILMCTNLVFLTIFMAAWYNTLKKAGGLYLEDAMTGDRSNVIFASSQDFIITMMLFLGWLVAGQKMDELLRSLGLSAVQTGQGLMGAALGSMMVIRTAAHGIQAGAQSTGKFASKHTGGNAQLMGKTSDAAPPKKDPVKGPEKAPGKVPEFKGKSFDDGLNKAIHGQGEGKDWKGMKAPALGSEGSSARAVNAKDLNWQPANDAKGNTIPGVEQAYHAKSGNTYTRSTNADGVRNMHTSFGASAGHRNELTRINAPEMPGGYSLVNVQSGDIRNMDLPSRQDAVPISNSKSV